MAKQDNSTKIKKFSLAKQERHADLEIKMLEIKEKQKELEEWEKRRIDNEFTRTSIEKVTSLCLLLESVNIDENRTVFSSELFYKPSFNEQERLAIRKKILSLMDQL